MFFFPAESKDSCWSGLIYQPQTNEMNSPNLSYLLIPAKDKLVLLYNSFYDNGQPIASSTYIDHQGNILNQGGVIFWKYKTELHFQEARQIEGNEVVIPYNDNQRSGFAIVQLH